jgi:hypothetical protein
MKTAVMSLCSLFEILNQVTDYYEILCDVILVETSLFHFIHLETTLQTQNGFCTSTLDSYIQPHF